MFSVLSPFLFFQFAMHPCIAFSHISSLILIVLISKIRYSLFWLCVWLFLLNFRCYFLCRAVLFRVIPIFLYVCIWYLHYSAIRLIRFHFVLSHIVNNLRNFGKICNFDSFVVRHDCFSTIFLFWFCCRWLDVSWLNFLSIVELDCGQKIIILELD